jgi:uncharacterized protein YcfJ
MHNCIYLDMEIKMTTRKVLKIGLVATALAFAGGFIGQFARADSGQMGIVDDIYQNYDNVTYSNPIKVCKDMQIPIYGQSGGQASTGNTLFGALIGGALGNQVGGGKGKDAATVLGAIIGADVANKRSGSNTVIVGYSQERRCEMQHRSVNKRVPTDYTVTYSWNGIYGQSRTMKPYSIGSKIPIKVTIQTR